MLILLIKFEIPEMSAFTGLVVVSLVYLVATPSSALPQQQDGAEKQQLVVKGTIPSPLDRVIDKQADNEATNSNPKTYNKLFFRHHKRPLNDFANLNAKYDPPATIEQNNDSSSSYVASLNIDHDTKRSTRTPASTGDKSLYNARPLVEKTHVQDKMSLGEMGNTNERSEYKMKATGLEDYVPVYKFARCTFCETSTTYFYYLKNNGFESAMLKLRNGNKKACSCNNTLHLCDCSGLNLTQAPADIPEDVIGLDLFNNSFENTGFKTLSKFKSLKFLRLCCNNLTELASSDLGHFSRLEYLNVVDNQIPMLESSFPGGLKALKNLTHLELQGNNPDPRNTSLRYPDASLADLTRLESLQMDGLVNQSLGAHFATMSNLQNVGLNGFSSGYCDLGFINQTTFAHLPKSLTYLNISNCNLLPQDGFMESFTPLENLKVLDFSHNENLGIHLVVETLCRLKNSTIEHLVMSSILSRYSYGIQIFKSDAECLPRRLRHIETIGNSIESFESGVFEHFPENLSSIDVSDNKLQFGRYLRYVSKLENLQELFVKGSDYLYRIPVYYPTFSERISPPYNEKRRAKKTNVFLNDGFNDSPLLGGKKIFLKLPPNLKKVSMQKYGLRYRLSELNVHENNSLETLDINYNYFPYIYGPFNGLTSLRNLSVVGSSVTFIKDTFFKSLPSLTYLNVGRNYLGTKPAFNERIFRYASNLTELDLRFNSIKTVSSDTFFNLKNLKILRLQGNPFWDFRANLSHMPKLEYLDLSNTETSHLVYEIRKMVESMPQLRINMRDAPIFCDCKNLEFIEWLSSQSKHFNLDEEGYMCVYQYRKSENITDHYKLTLDILRGECIQQWRLFYVVLAGSGLVVMALLGAIVYRFRWNLRYFYYAAYLRFKQEATTNDDFQYDVFLSYAHADDLFVRESLEPALSSRGLKVLLHARHFTAGEFIGSNITRAVMVSRKTLVVLTNELLKSNWCHYELQMAILEANSSGRQVLIFMIKDKLPKNKLSTLMLSQLQTNTYLPFPPPSTASSPVYMARFWDTLVRDIRN